MRLLWRQYVAAPKFLLTELPMGSTTYWAVRRGWQNRRHMRDSLQQAQIHNGHPKAARKKIGLALR